VNKLAIYPGTFDPMTYGHLDVIERTLDIFPEVLVAVTETSRKKLTFSLEERLAMVKQATRGLKGVRVEPFGGLVVDFARRNKTNILVRGLRMISDFEYEFQLAGMNHKLNKNFETVFLMAEIENQIISSNFVKEIAALKGDLVQFVPNIVIKALKTKFK
jgi:pantetheine-phosphate adenylyltransferase